MRDTQAITFRIQRRLLGLLRSQAERRRVSLNTLVTQILGDFAEWDISAVDAGWMVFPKPVLRELVDKLDNSSLEAIARRKAQFYTDAQMLMLSSSNVEHFLRLLQDRAKKSGFAFSETRQGRSVTLILQHDMGQKWSFFNQKMYEHVLSDLGQQVTILTTPNTISMTVELPSD